MATSSSPRTRARVTAWVAAASVALVVLVTPEAARADDKASAQALFDEGLALYDAREFAKAATSFASSQKLDPAAGTLLNLARCYEAMGSITSAWRTYGAAATMARRDGDEKRERAAAQKEGALLAMVPRLTVAVSDSSTGNVRVERDGTPLESSTLGVPQMLDPGLHKVSASAPGHKSWSVDLTLAVGETKRLDVPPLELLPSRATSTGIAEQPEEDSHALGTQRKIAIVTAGVGLLGVGVGAYFGLHAQSLKSDADQHCSSAGKCDADGVSLTDRAGTAADLATGFFIAGGAFLAGAVVLWVTAPSLPPSNASISGASTSERRRISATPLVGPSMWGGALRISY